MAITNYDGQTFEEIIKEGFSIVDFYGEGCGPCEAFAEVLDDLNFELPFINIIKVKTDVERDFAKKNRIMAVPTIHFIKDGEIVKTQTGYMNIEQVKETVAEFIY